MPGPPTGEADLRALALRYTQAESQVLALLNRAINGDRRSALSEALAHLTALRRLDHRSPIVTAYLHEHPEGSPDAVRDLAGSLHQRLDRAARTAADGAHQAFPKVTPDNLEETAALAVLANVDRRGTHWSLSRWADMTTQTIGRQATSRGITDSEGEGAHVTINTGQCELCSSHGGDAIIGERPLPPYHPSCTCTATR